MLKLKEQVTHDLETLSESELCRVAEYVAFLKFQARVKLIGPLDETSLAALCAKFAEEDRSLAEEGISDYMRGLNREDS